MTYALNILHFEVDQTVIVVGPKSHFVMTQNHAYLSQLCLNLRIEVNFHALRFRPKWDIAHLGLKYDFGPSKVGRNPFKSDIQCRFTYLILGPKSQYPYTFKIDVFHEKLDSILGLYDCKAEDSWPFRPRFTIQIPAHE